ncbi:hypothetical protein F4809DRAFT_630978 [Biscogniauxia mediterranea]|nr:hypothetical protein F4809DRAFT_630978 [Biscogniauxia mediterranea]
MRERATGLGNTSVSLGSELMYVSGCPTQQTSTHTHTHTHTRTSLSLSLTSHTHTRDAEAKKKKKGHGALEESGEGSSKVVEHNTIDIADVWGITTSSTLPQYPSFCLSLFNSNPSPRFVRCQIFSFSLSLSLSFPGLPPPFPGPGSVLHTLCYGSSLVMYVCTYVCICVCRQHRHLGIRVRSPSFAVAYCPVGPGSRM